MKTSFRSIIYLLLCVTFLGCSPKESHPNMLRVNLAYDPTTLDPRKGRDVATVCAQVMFYEGLTRMTPTSTSDLGLAEQIEISDDRTVYTFHLRDALWSDGQPVTADDFAYAWRSMLDPEFPCPNVNMMYGIKNAELAKQGKVGIDQVGIRTDGSKRFIVELESPIPYFLEIVSFSVFFPVPSHVARGNDSWPDKDLSTVVSCGPYTLEKWSHRDEMVVSKSRTYWDRENVNHDRVRISFVENQNTVYQMYERGELDFMGTMFTTLPLDVIGTLQEKGVLKSFNIAGTTFCTYNTQHAMLSNKQLRRALSLALDRQSMVDNITQLSEEAGTALIPSVMRLGEKKALIQDAATTEARIAFSEALEELGVTRDSIHFSMVYPISDENHKIAQEIQQQWFRNFGIMVTLEGCERSTFLDKMQRGDYEIGLAFLLAQYNDQMNILERFRLRSNPKNYCNWENETYGELLAQAMLAPNEVLRHVSMEKAEKILLDEMPLTPIYHWCTTYVKQPYIENVYFSPVGAIHLPSVKINTGKKKYGH